MLMRSEGTGNGVWTGTGKETLLSRTLPGNSPKCYLPNTLFLSIIKKVIKQSCSSAAEYVEVQLLFECCEVFILAASELRLN